MSIKKLLLSIFTIGALVTVAQTSSAQDLSLRAEGGLAIPLTSPQSDRFNPGINLAIKPQVGLGSYFGVGPLAQLTVLTSDVSGQDAGAATKLGAFIGVHRPHDEKNSDTGFAAASPWLDIDAGYVRTGDLNRFGTGVSVGVAFPTNDKKDIFVGPYANYSIINQDNGGHFGYNTNSSKTLTIGLSIEFGPSAKVKHEPKREEYKEQPVQPEQKANTETKKPESKFEVVQFRQKVQFPWDSSKLQPSENPALKQILDAMLADTTFHVTIEGHASSEGQKAHNNKLSQKRAESVMAWLAANGVDKSRMTAVGLGSDKPVATNKTETGRILNRRAELDIIFTMEKKQ